MASVVDSASSTALEMKVSPGLTLGNEAPTPAGPVWRPLGSSPTSPSTVSSDLESSVVSIGGLTSLGEPHTVSFKDIVYKVTTKKNKAELQILKKLSGTFKPGACTAVMGPSGAGKVRVFNNQSREERGKRVAHRPPVLCVLGL